MPTIPAPVTAVYRSIPPPVRGVLLMMISGIAITGMNISVKFIATDIHPFVIAFWRHLFGICLLAPMLLGKGANPLRTGRLGLHSLRALLNIVAMLAYFVALTLEPLATIVALSFTAPLIATLGAMVFLKERVSPMRSLALLIGLCGALIILRPWAAAVSDGAFLLLLSSTIWAGALVVIKVLSRTESAVTIALYASVLQVPFAFVAALLYWQWPTLSQFGVLVAIAVFGVSAQLGLSQAFREADATVVLPADLTKLIFAGAAGWLFFSEAPAIWIWIGGVVVFGGVFLNALFDRRDRQRLRGAASASAPTGTTVVANLPETPHIPAETEEKQA